MIEAEHQELFPPSSDLPLSDPSDLSPPEADDEDGAGEGPGAESGDEGGEPKKNSSRRWLKAAREAIRTGMADGTIPADAHIEVFHLVAARAHLREIAKLSVSRRAVYGFVGDMLERAVERVEELDKAVGRKPKSLRLAAEPNQKIAQLERFCEEFKSYFPDNREQGVANKFWNPVKAAAGYSGLKEDIKDDAQIKIMEREAKAILFDLAKEKEARGRAAPVPAAPISIVARCPADPNGHHGYRRCVPTWAVFCAHCGEHWSDRPNGALIQGLVTECESHPSTKSASE